MTLVQSSGQGCNAIIIQESEIFVLFTVGTLSCGPAHAPRDAHTHIINHDEFYGYHVLPAAWVIT